MGLALDAEARGDAGAALELHLAGPIVSESLTHHSLRELALLGDEAPAWMCSRWAVDQAQRWMLVNEDPRCDDLVRTVLASLHFDAVEPFLHDEVAVREYGTLVAASDWAYHQVATYEGGGLRDFLDIRAERGLLDRLDEIDEWEQAAITAYELVSASEDVLHTRRMTDGREVQLLNLGAASDIGTPSTVVGRVVPISVWPFAMFESRPLHVDRETAEAVAVRMAGDDDLGWLWELSNAYHDGRLPAGSTFGHGTLWSTDIVPMGSHDAESSAPSEAGRMKQLRAAGLSELVASGVCVCEVGLIVASVSRDVSAVAPHVTAVLMDPQVHEALKVHATAAGRAQGWRALARATPSPVRERCLELAAISDRPAS